jgi:hypothetical protein
MGAPSGAPNNPRKRRRRRRGAPTITGRPSLSHNAAVINWVRERYRDGWDREQIVSASKAGTDDWPVPDDHLSNGTMSECRAVIAHMERMGASWPLTGDALPRGTGRKSSMTGKRLHEVGAKRSQARRAGDPGVFWDTCYEITKLSSLLQSLEVEHLELDEYSLDTVSDLLEDMLFLQDWMDRTIMAVQARLGEQALVSKVAALRLKTVENGCTPDEEASAKRAADRLEAKINARRLAA